MALGRQNSRGGLAARQSWQLTGNSQINTRDRADVDEGLRRYMLRVYNYMALGVALTGLITLFMANNPQLMFNIAVGPFKWVLFIGIIGLGFLAPRIMLTRSTMAAHACYWAYAAMWGLLISPMIFYFLSQQGGTADIARAFFITAGMFAGMSLFGYTTKRDLSPMGRVLMMVAIGLLLAVIVNIFLGSMGFQLLLSFGVVGVFALLTAFETQQIKQMYYSASDGDEVTKMAIFGAFMLYGSFVTMFIWILQIMAILRGE
jgi:hypothetical protein